MAASDAKPIPIKNTALRITFPIYDADGDLVSGATGLDSEVSKDGGSFADCTNEATEIGSSGIYYLDLTSTEMNADTVALCVKTSTSGAKTTVIVMYPQEAGDVTATVEDYASGKAPLQPTTAGRTLDVTATGAAGIDWGNVENPTTTVALTNTTTADPPGVTTLLSRLSSSRAGYLDNLNVGGAVASQADINAINQSASRRIIITSVQQFERPESGDSAATFTIEARTYDGDGAAVNADSTPTLTTTGTVTGSLAANLSSATNPATGVYRWTYTVASSHAIEQIRFDLSATMSSAFTLSHYAQVVNFVATTFTAADRTKLEALNSDWADGGRLDLILDSRASQTSVDDVPNNSEFNARTLAAASYATAAVLGTPAGASIAADIAAVKTDVAAVKVDTGSLVTRITSTLFSGITYLSRWLGALAGKTADATTLAEMQATTAGAGFNNTTDSLEAIRDRGDEAWTTGGGGGGGGDATLAKQEEIITHLTDIKGAGWSSSTDTLKKIRDALPVSTGAGAYTLTITVNDGAAALQNAIVRLTEGATSLSGTTNASGQVAFSVDAATWSVAITKDGYQFTPTTKVVAGSGSQTYSMSAVSISPPASPTLSTVVVTVRNSAGAALKDVNVKVRIKEPPPGEDGDAYTNEWLSYKATDAGVVTMTLVRNATYELQVFGYSSLHEFTPSTATYEIPNLVAS